MESENPFTSTPPSSSVENSLRMGQVLYAKGDIPQALQKYHEICLQSEKIILMNPGANIDLKWPAFALGYISDIYSEKEDYNKALLYRNVQHELLNFMKNQKNSGKNDSDSDGEEGRDFMEVASVGIQVTKIFEKLHKAMESPELPPRESPQEIAKKIMDARHKEEEDKIEEVIRQLNEATAAKEKEIQGSFFKRNIRRITDHPVVFVIVMLLITAAVILFVRYKPKKRANVPGGFEAQMAYLSKYVKDYEKKKGINHDNHDHHGHSHGGASGEEMIKERMAKIRANKPDL